MNSLVLQRRAVYTVLQDWLEEDKLMEALLILEDQHQNKPSIAVNDYIPRIKHLFQRETDTKQIHRRLMEMLVRRPKDLAPDPLPLLQRAKASADDPTINLEPTAEQQALHSMISQIMGNLSATQKKQLHIRMAKQLSNRFVNGSFDTLSQYLISENPQYLAGFTDQALRSLVNVIYVGCCEVLGPIDADQRFGTALQTLDQTHPGARSQLDGFL